MNTILITGANRGIGLALAKQYFEDGWHVFACVRCAKNFSVFDDVVSLSKNTAGKITPICLDVSDHEQIKKLPALLSHLPVDIIFNNAGVFGSSQMAFEQVQSESWLEIFKVNTMAPFLISQVLLPQVVKGKFKIIANMSSIMGSIQEDKEGGYYMYRTSKAALNMVTKTLAIDLKNYGVTVVSLHPGWVKTSMGGPHALITTEESVLGLKKVLQNLSLKDSGSFLNYAGKPLLW